ncbi:MAG: hypothetical protein LBF15_04270 [Candidatus Peribacteria bacterium]|jgi:hypothetical protein|nr:hypothetical protein [Candidatus Peribacteria bacterium]
MKAHKKISRLKKMEYEVEILKIKNDLRVYVWLLLFVFTIGGIFIDYFDSFWFWLIFTFIYCFIVLFLSLTKVFNFVYYNTLLNNHIPIINYEYKNISFFRIKKPMKSVYLEFKRRIMNKYK